VPPSVAVWRPVRQGGDTKTARSRRTLALPQTATQALREHRRRQAEDRLAAGALRQDHGLVFTSTIGTPLDASNVRREFQKITQAAGQDVEPAEGSDGTDGRWRIARKVAPDRVISTVDPEARHTRKSKSQRRDGFRGRVAAEPETGLITDCEMTMAAGEGTSDADNGVKMASRDQFADGSTPDGTAAPGGEPAAAALQPGGLEIYGDSAYGIGDARVAYRDAGTVRLVPRDCHPE
jgi:hypothetical protein